MDNVAEISGTTFVNNGNNGEIIVENNEAEKSIDENLQNENLIEETDSDEENQENLVDISELEENSQEPIQNEEEFVEKILLNSKCKLQMMQYEKECGAMAHGMPSDSKTYGWLNDPWPWEYSKI